MPESRFPLSSILLVDDDPTVVRQMSTLLQGLAQESPPDLFLLDAEMPGMSGFELCKRLKATPALAEVPVIFVTSHTEAAFEVEGFALGAADFVAKPVHGPLLLARVKAQLRFKRMADELRLLARRDALTGVANRRAFDEALIQEWRRSIRLADPLCLLLIDIDHFQAYNERYGQTAGDRCLCAIADRLSQVGGRPGDLVARIGGEEFALLLSHTDRAGAEHIAHRVLDAVEALQIPNAGSGVARHVTVSIGIGSYDQKSPLWVGSDAEGREVLAEGAGMVQLVQAADAALAGAKKGGRAHALVLDLAQFDTPQAAEDITPKR